MLSRSHLNQKSSYKVLRECLYTPLEEAIYLLDVRQKQNLNLPCFDIPEALRIYPEWQDHPHPHTAILSRHIATPNYEIRRVVELCDKHQLNLLILCFQEDKFSPNNACKYALGRMGFFAGLDCQNEKKTRYRTIINFNQSNGRLLRECKTYRGQSLVTFHHDLLLKEFPQLSNNIFDNSAWFIRNRLKTGNFYRENLKLFLKHAILFETFVLLGSELDFTLTHVLPAFQEIVNTFGIKPLIVHSEAQDMEGDNYWQLYPDHLHPFAPYDRRKKPRPE